MTVKLTVLESQGKILAREKPAVKKTTEGYCMDCNLDWCKIRNKVVYCSQKYKGTSCYSCKDGSCNIKPIAGY